MKPTDPTPAEIESACREIRDGWTPDEALRAMRADLRPMVRTADGRLVAVSADDYEQHSERGFGR